MTDYSTEAQAVADAMNAVYENKQTNKKNSISGDYSSDNESYPTVKAVKAEYGTKVNSWSSTVSDDNLPSEKLVKDTIDGKASSSHTHGNLTNDGKVGTNANYFITTTTGGAVTSQQKIGDINTSGQIGSTANKPLITTTSGKITTGSFGTSANTFCEGNDSRLSDSRTPTSHSHGDISNDGKIGSTANLPLITTTGGAITVGSFGTSANTFCQGNDSRLSDARTPTSHNQASSTITDTNTYSHIGNSSGTQESINSAINTKLGELVDINFVTVVSELPTASSSTMGKIYLVAISGSGTNNYAEYVTVKTGTSPNFSYNWEKFGEVSGSGLSVDWSDITNKPSSFTPASHTHGNLSNDGKLGTTSGKPVITTTGGAITTGSFGSTAGTFAEGNHTHSSYTTTSDVASEISDFATALAAAINPSS